MSSGLALELYMGTTLHDGLAGIARGLPIDEIAAAAYKQMYDTLITNGGDVGEGEVMEFAKEQATLVEGLLRGFYRQVWPVLTTQYPNVLAIEQEMVYEHDGLSFMAKPDLVLGDNEGNAVYVEYKSTASKKDNWVNSWGTAIQLHSTIKAIEATLGVKVAAVIVQGLYKGYESYGKQSSPFSYCYKRQGNPPFSETHISYDYKPGFKRYPTWELEGGVKKWVEDMPIEVLTAQFPRTPPIFVKDELVEAFFKQTSYREHEIQLARQMLEIIEDPEARNEILNVTFPQTFSECFPAWGKPCPFRSICHGNLENPLEHGFQKRIPHHEPELNHFNGTP